MTPQDLVAVFEDTQRMIRDSAILLKQLEFSQCNSQLYLEGYVSPIRKQQKHRKIQVLENTTFQCAREFYPQFSKVAVLNFANPHEPGGGVKHGAMAQEECLCRCSDLYDVLNQPYFLKQYYQYHQKNCDLFFSDRLIYSPDITVFKSDDIIPQMLDNPFQADVITCAAPFLKNGHKMTDDELLLIYQSRIRNILEVAMSKEVDCLILGAFGCGAFRNNPQLMAKAFSQLLMGEEYIQFFDQIVFAIKRSGEFCKNLYYFEEAFGIIN